jgi:predicted dithiol-disulfide oxidoreductase (DUF899 family)
MAITFPGESAEYRTARDRLLASELELRRAIEAVAVARRALPDGGAVREDYVFRGLGADGQPADVRLSELFEDGKDTLVIYHMMFPRSPDSDLPCPSCTGFLGTFDGLGQSAAERINLAIVAKAPLERLLAYADEQGWNRLRFYSAGGSTFNRDYHAEAENGQQLPMTNVFRRQNGEIRHFWGSELFYAPTDPGQDPRHNDLLDPYSALFDLTPDGRGD